MIDDTQTVKKIFFLTATFNRQSLTRKSILDLQKQLCFDDLDAEIWVIEAGDHKKTNAVLKDIVHSNLNLIKVPDDTFWTSAMAIGIERIADKASADDIIICFNNDIEIPDQILTRIISQVIKQPKLVISPLSVSPHSDRVVATGVIVKNWWLAINETPFNDLNFKSITNSELFEVDYLTQRLMAFRARLIFEAGNYNSKWLPHYGGDYEFTLRAKRKGYIVAIDPKIKVYIDEKKTGLNSKYRQLTFMQRIISLFSVRSSNNLIKNIKFSLLTAPLIVQPFNLISIITKSIILAFFVSPRSSYDK